MKNTENTDESQLTMPGFKSAKEQIDTDNAGGAPASPTVPVSTNAPASQADAQAEPLRAAKIGRNELCPCGSGKKYKKCCGFTAAGASSNGGAQSAKPAEPTKEQWAELFAVADTLKKMAPWEHLWSSDVITLMLPGREDPVYCTIAGRGGECFGIGVYPDNLAFREFIRILDTDESEPPFFTNLDQQCLLCNFGDREDVTPKDREAYQMLGLKFRGQNQWVYFRAVDPGFAPWYIDSEQAELLIKALQNLIPVCEQYAAGQLEADFDSGDTIVRYYSAKDKAWLNTVKELPPISINIAYLQVTDEILIARLKKQKRNKAELEFDSIYFPAPVCEQEGGRPYLPKLIMLADKDSGIVLDQHMLAPDEDIEEVIISMINDYVMEFGRPAAIYARDERVGRFLEDLCQKANINLYQGKGMPAINALLLDLVKHLSGGYFDFEPDSAEKSAGGSIKGFPEA